MQNPIASCKDRTGCVFQVNIDRKMKKNWIIMLLAGDINTNTGPKQNYPCRPTVCHSKYTFKDKDDPLYGVCRNTLRRVSSTPTPAHEAHNNNTKWLCTLKEHEATRPDHIPPSYLNTCRRTNTHIYPILPSLSKTRNNSNRMDHNQCGSRI